MADSPPSIPPRTKPPGLVYTFYSYKGGVGRSMALANVGVLMAAEGHRVLLVDWDLEAPGLEVYFRNAGKLASDPSTTPGVIDLLENQAQGKTLPWRDCLLEAKFFGHSLHIISSGRRTEDYRQRVQQLNWETLFGEHRIGNYINALREEWRNAYDFVLVDSRTGITDIGDICTVILPDVLVLLFVTNHQNVEGIKNIMARAVKARSKLPVNRNKLLGVPVPCRDERDRESDKFAEWKDIFSREFSYLYREWLPKEVDPADALNKIYLPYIAGWSFGERIPVIESDRERTDPSTLGAAYARLATILSHHLDWTAIEAKATTADVIGQRVELSKAREEAREAEMRLEEAKKAAVKTRKRYRNIAIAFAAMFLLTAGMLVPALNQAKQRAESIACVNNMKQILLGFRIWASDNGDNFPFNVSTNEGGTFQFRQPGEDGFDRNGFWSMQVLSNELNSTKILVCPTDPSKKPALDFEHLTVSNLTYEVRSGTNINEAYPDEILIRCPIHGHVGLCDGSVQWVNKKK